MSLIAIVALASGGCGCGSKPATVKTDYLGTRAPTVSNAGFEELVQIGRDAEIALPKLLVRTSFYPGQRKQAKKALAPLLTRLSKLQRNSIPFAYTPVGLDPEAPGRKGWRLLGRTLVWGIEEAIAEGNSAAAITRWRVATRLGFDISGGSAADVTLGLAIADEARAALVVGLPKWPAGTLSVIATTSKALLKEKPLLDQAVNNEVANRRIALSRVAGAFAEGSLQKKADMLGSSAYDDLHRIAIGSAEKAESAFEGVAGELDEIEKELAADTKRPATQRIWEFKSGPTRGRMMRRALLGGIDSALQMNDITLARTRLLAATCTLRARTLSGQALPKRLRELGEGYTDPFSGFTLPYRRAGKQFSVYSVGVDGKDDGGESDSSGLKPDLRLETAIGQ